MTPLILKRGPIGTQRMVAMRGGRGGVR